MNAIYFPTNTIGKIRDIISRTITGTCSVSAEDDTLFITIISSVGSAYHFKVENLYSKFSQGYTSKDIAYTALNDYKKTILKTEFRRKF